MDHENFMVIQCGLILDPEFPFMGATPDGLVNCKCCDTGVLEIKCHYNYFIYNRYSILITVINFNHIYR